MRIAALIFAVAALAGCSREARETRTSDVSPGPLLGTWSVVSVNETAEGDRRFIVIEISADPALPQSPFHFNTIARDGDGKRLTSSFPRCQRSSPTRLAVSFFVSAAELEKRKSPIDFNATIGAQGFNDLLVHHRF